MPVAEPTTPAGYTVRPPTPDDLAPTLALLNACDRPWTECDWHAAVVLEGFWKHPDIVISRDVRIVLDDGGVIVGYVQVWTAPPFVHTRVFGRVHPDHRGRGLGTALHAWGETLGRSIMTNAPADARLSLHGWTIQGNDDAATLLADRGMVAHRHSFNMHVPLDPPPPSPSWLDGIELRPFDRSQVRVLFEAQREAFRDHYGIVERDVESDFRRHMHWMEHDPRWDADLVFVAWDGDEIAGASECWAESDEDPDMGWIAQLGVRRPWRRRGLARALLLHSFAALRGLGKTRAGLSVDASSITGATRLYESVGMTPYLVFDDYEKELRPGRELGTVEVDEATGA